MDKNLMRIAEELYDICYDVDLKITNQSPDDARYLAKSNSVRHAQTINLIMNFAEQHDINTIRILNASGLSCGTQDFSIVNYFKHKSDLHIEWCAYESPHSRYLGNSLFQHYVHELGIDIELVDFALGIAVQDVPNTLFDVVLFTEIAEHLDYSILIKTLLSIQKKIADHGVLIITTPNLVSLINRLKFFAGIGDAPFWGDGLQNMEQGLYGHITNYCMRRLKKIGSSSFQVGYA